MGSLISSVILAIALIGAVLAGDNPLGPYNITDVTVSGISSGGYMAVQMHIAYSATIQGAAVFAAVS